MDKDFRFSIRNYRVILRLGDSHPIHGFFNRLSPEVYFVSRDTKHYASFRNYAWSGALEEFFE